MPQQQFDPASLGATPAFDPASLGATPEQTNQQKLQAILAQNTANTKTQANVKPPYPTYGSTLPGIWNAANQPVGYDPENPNKERDLVIKMRNFIADKASGLPESLRTPAVYAGNTAATLLMTPAEMGRRFMTPVGVSLLGAGAASQAAQAPGVPNAVKLMSSLGQRALGVGFGAQGAMQATSTGPPGESALSEFERRASGAGQALMGAAAVGPQQVTGKTAIKSARAIYGAGELRVSRAIAKRAAEVADLEQGYAADVAAARETNLAKAAEVEAGYAGKLADARAAHADEIYKAEQGHIEKTLKVQGQNEVASRTEARRQIIPQAQESYANVLMDNARQVLASEKARLDARWDGLREKTAGASGDPARIRDIDPQARAKYLENATPDSLHKYNSIIEKATEPIVEPDAIIANEAAQNLGYKDAAQASKRMPMNAFEGFVEKYKAERGTATGQGTAFGQLRAQFTRLGEVLASGNLPPDVYQAIKFYRAGLDVELTRIADTKGIGGEYRALKADHSQYVNDFHDTSSIAGGGASSPLARLVRAQDAPIVLKQVLGDSAVRLAKDFSRYSGRGARPGLMTKIKMLNAEVSSLPKGLKTKPLPGPLQTPKFEAPVKPQAPELKLPPRPQMPQKVNPEEVRLKHLEDRALADWKWHELGLLPYTIKRGLISSRGVREWLAKERP